MVVAYTVAGTANVVGRGAGTGRVVDAHTHRASGIEKVVRDADTGVALGSFDSWAAVIDWGWQLGAQAPRHPVSDGDAAIAAGIDPVCGRGAPHRLCVVHLLRHLTTGADQAWDDIAFGASQSGTAAAGKLGTVGTEHDLLARLQYRGLFN